MKKTADNGGTWLRLIRGGRDREFMLGPVPVTVVSTDAVLEEIDVQIREEDTHLVLSVEPIIQEPRESLRQLGEEMVRFDSRPPGSVLIRRGRVPQLLAVIHDLDHEPTWREGWITEALVRVLEIARQRGLRALALPLLGTLHGRLQIERAFALLQQALTVYPPLPGTKIWLQLRREKLPEAIAALEQISVDTK